MIHDTEFYKLIIDLTTNKELYDYFTNQLYKLKFPTTEEHKELMEERDSTAKNVEVITQKIIIIVLDHLKSKIERNRQC